MTHLAQIVRSAFRSAASPLACLWIASAGLAVAYCSVPAVEPYFSFVERFHLRFGLLSVLVDRTLFCGLVPACFMYAVKELRVPRIAAVCFAQTVWNVLWGLVCNGVFLLQARCFGTGTDWQTLAIKTCVDQLVFTPLVISPASALFCFWLARDMSFSRVRKEWPGRFYRRLVAPNLVAGWVISIPVTAVMFTFPTALQIHVNSLNCAVATILLLQIGRRSGRNAAACPAA